MCGPVARRSSQNFFADIAGAMLRLSHRVPLIGLFIAIACGVGWWYFRGHPAIFGARVWSIAFAVLSGFFGLIAVVGLLRNLFPEGGTGGRRRG